MPGWRVNYSLELRAGIKCRHLNLQSSRKLQFFKKKLYKDIMDHAFAVETFGTFNDDAKKIHS